MRILRQLENMTPEPLNDSDFESLANVLQRFGGKRAMDVEQVDGFLAALVCCPSDIAKTKYLPEFWGDEKSTSRHFSAQPMLQQLPSWIARHQAAIAHTLESGDVFTPALLADAKGVFLGNDWANGFVRGMNLRKQELGCPFR
jgi:uncharacterized protein